MTGHTPWAVLKVRTRLKRGWNAWVAPGGRTVWARMRDQRGLLRMETNVITPDELAVLDDVLTEVTA